MVFLMLIMIHFFLKYQFHGANKDVRKKFVFENRWILFFLLSIFTNLVSCQIYRGQTIGESLSNTELLWFFFILSFYIYVYQGYSIQQIESAIKKLYLCFCVVYLMQYFIFYPHHVFYMLSLMESEHRFRLNGQYVLFWGYFYYLNVLIMTKKPLAKDIFALLLGFFVIILLGFRTGIVGIVLSSGLMVIRIKGFSYKIIKYFLIAGIIGVCVIATPVGRNILDNMIERNETESFDNEDYIRVKQFMYFSQEHFKSDYERFWGSGMANVESKYGKYYVAMLDPGGVTSRAQWRDWGLIGLSWIMGIPMFLVMLFLIFYMIFKKTDKNHYYVSCLYLFMLMSGITTVEVYRNGAFVFHGLMLYLMGLIKNKLKDENRNNYAAIRK